MILKKKISLLDTTIELQLHYWINTSTSKDPSKVALLHKAKQFWEGEMTILGNLRKIMTSRQNLLKRTGTGWVGVRLRG